ncbi:MAG: hypothetical protein LBD51_01790 [Bifidobacteriaceae bacterium]|jgi:hypothetical protein|nr:hypothetical protein [Bifidobacteriaceae bacterium]
MRPTISDTYLSFAAKARLHGIGLADFDCRQQTDYLGRFAAIQLQFETAWVAGHRDLLDSFEAAAESHRQQP